MADRTIPAFKILRGSVGVGTTLPSSTFHVYSDSSTNTIINLQGGSATNKGAYMNFFRGTTNVGALGTKASLIGGTSNDMMFYSASNDWIFYSTGERMRVQADGLVGIGTNAPSSLLHVYGSSSYLLDVHQTAVNWAARIKNTSGGGYGLSIDTSTSTANNVATLACYTPSGIGVFVTNQGRLAVGLTAPEAPLDVSGNSIVRGTLYFDGLSSSYIDNASHDLQMRGAGGVSLWTHTGGNWVEQVTVADGGSVGIGTNNPGQLLEVGNDGNTDYALIGPTKIGGGMGHGNYAGFSHRDMGGTGNYALIQSSSGHTYLNSASGQNLSFRINNSDTMYMSSAALNFNDSKKVILGNDSDLQLFHDGSNSYIQNGSTGSLNVTLNAGNEFAARFVKDAAVELYYNGVQQCETLSNGLKINNPANNIGYLFGGDGEILAGQDSGGYYYATGSGQNVSKPVQIGSNASYIKFKTANTERVRITSTGLVGIGTASALASSGEQLAVYSASTGHSCFKNSSDGTGTVYFRNASQTANTWQPYLILSDSGGNRGGLAIKYSTAGLKVHGQGGIEFWTGSSFGGGTVKMTIASGGTVSVGGNFTIPQGNLLYLDGGSNTYIYSDTADSISYVTNSGIRLITNNSGLTIPSNNNLSLGNGANNAGKFRFYNNNSTAYYIDWKSTGARSYEFEGSSSGSDYVTSFSNADSSGGHNLNIEGMLRVKNKAGNTNRFTVSDSGVVTWGSNADSGHGQMSWDTGKAYIYGTSGNALAMGANGNGNIMHIKTNYEVHIGAGNGLQGVAIHGNTSGYGSIVGVSRDGSSYKNLEINGATVEFKAAGTVKMTVGSGGVGIGMSPSSTYRLAVTGSTNTPVQLLSTADNLNLTLGNSTQTQFSNILFNSNSGNAQIWKAGGSYTAYGGPNSLNLYSSNGKIAFHPNGAANKVLIDTNGYVGIGTNNPAQLLHMEGTVVKLRMKETGSQTWDLYAAGSRWALRVNDADKLTVNNGGNVGVGTDAPTNQLHVYNATDISPSSAGAGQFAITGNGYTGFIAMDGSAMYFGHNSSGRDLRLMTNETTRLYINGSGSVSVPGSFSASSKSFLIDHPTKENKKLEYGCLEGPEFGVYHRGRVQSNTITLPDYWTALVREETITVQLTSNGSFQHLYVVSQSLTEIVIGAADGETIDCFYTIYGERADIDSLVVEKEV